MGTEGHLSVTKLCDKGFVPLSHSETDVILMKPLYVRIADDIIKSIKDGNLKPGDMLPSSVANIILFIEVKIDRLYKPII
jgi:hypothetical protein